MSNNISDSAMKGATTGALIGARFGPQGIAIGAAVLCFFQLKVFAENIIITVWNYYLVPPFYISDKEGLAFDLVGLNC